MSDRPAQSLAALAQQPAQQPRDRVEAMQHTRAGQEGQGGQVARNSLPTNTTKRALLDAQLSESLSDETCTNVGAGLLGSLLEQAAGSPRPRKIRVRGSQPDGGAAFGGHPAAATAPAVAVAAVPELSLASLLVAAHLASGGDTHATAACSLLPSTQATLAATTASVVAAEMLAAVSRPTAAAPCGGSGSPVSLAPGTLGLLLPLRAMAQQSTDAAAVAAAAAAATPQPALAVTAAGLQLPSWLCEKSAELAASQAICRASLLSTTAALARLRSPRSPVIAAAAAAGAHTSSPALHGAAAARVSPPSNWPAAEAAGEDASSCSSTPRAQAAGESPGTLLAAAAAQLAAEAADTHQQQVHSGSDDKMAGSKASGAKAAAEVQQQLLQQHELCGAQAAVVVRIGAAPGDN